MSDGRAPFIFEDCINPRESDFGGNAGSISANSLGELIAQDEAYRQAAYFPDDEYDDDYDDDYYDDEPREWTQKEKDEFALSMKRWEAEEALRQYWETKADYRGVNGVDWDIRKIVYKRKEPEY